MMLVRNTVLVSAILGVLIGLKGVCGGYNILFMLPISSHSHRNVFNPLIQGLAERGHNLTVYSGYPSKPKTNVREVFMANVRSVFEDPVAGSLDPYGDRKSGTYAHVKKTMVETAKVCDRIVFNEKLLSKLRDEKPAGFDLIIFDGFLNECAFSFGNALNISTTAMVFTMGVPPWISARIGFPDMPAVTPNFFGGFKVPMSFPDRFRNAILNLYTTIVYDFIYVPRIKEVALKFFGESYVDFSDVVKETSLFLINTHLSSKPPMTLPPGVVEIGGMHCVDAQPLPKDLKSFADGSGKAGFIYFSLGSIARASAMPESSRLALVEAFRILKMRVLWKWEKDTMDDKPDNVKLAKFLPQQDILGHPNCRIFITHGGLLSQQEAIYHGVPLIGFPLFGDQDLNMRQAEQLGIGIKLEIFNLKPEDVVDSVRKILADKRYKENLQRRSRLMIDQPEHPKDRAVWWVEHILRHKGGDHLKLDSRNLNYLQYFLIDVLAVILCLLVTAVFVIKWAITKVTSALSNAARGKRALKRD